MQCSPAQAFEEIVASLFIVITQLLGATRALKNAHTAVDLAAPLTLILGVLVLAIGFQVALRGTWSEPSRTPIGLLETMEKRHAGRRKLHRFLPWATALIIAGTLSTAIVHTVADGHVDVRAWLFTLGVCAATAGFVWLVNTRLGGQVDREIREAREARKLLLEEEAAD